MKFRKKISILLLFLIFLIGVVYPIKAHAVLGVIDVGIDLGQVGTWIVDTVLKTILETLKYRLLNTITNRIINYIQGDGDPRFLKNFDGVLEDSFQAAVGDTIIELGASELCYDNMKFQIRADMEQPVFKNRVQCTLDDITENISSFRDNFSSGGWIAYQETLKPQNNPEGIRFLVEEEVQAKTEEKETASKIETSVNDGFISTKRCTQWIAIKNGALLIEELEDEPDGAELFNEGDTLTDIPEFYQQTPDSYAWNGKSQNPLSNWRCNNTEIVTPGQTSMEIVNKALGSDIDNLINTDGIGDYIAAIINAGINRLTKETVDGLAYLSDSDRNVKCSDLEGGERAACYAAKSATNASEKVTKKLKGKMNKDKTKDVDKSLDDVQASEDLLDADSVEEFVDRVQFMLTETLNDLRLEWNEYGGEFNSELENATTTLENIRSINQDAYDITTTTDGLIACRETKLNDIESDPASTQEDAENMIEKINEAILKLDLIEQDFDLIDQKIITVENYLNDWGSIPSEATNLYNFDINNVTSTLDNGNDFKLNNYEDDFYKMIEEIENLSVKIDEMGNRIIERKETIEEELNSCEELIEN